MASINEMNATAIYLRKFANRLRQQANDWDREATDLEERVKTEVANLEAQADNER